MNGKTLILSSAMAALTVSLAGCNTAPVALDDHASAPVGATTNINVLANDTDADADALFVKRAWGAGKGSVTINPDNTIAYRSNTGATGTDTFNYRVKDRRGAAANATVLVDLDRPVTIIEEREGVILGRPETVIVEEKIVPAPETTTIVVPEKVVVPAPAEPKTYIVTPPPTPMVDSMLVTLHTVDDDKNRDESVRLIVRRGSEVLAETTAGAGELWGNNSERSFELNLKPDVKLTDIGQLTIDVVKSAAGSGTGGGWIFHPQVLGRLDDGKLVTLLDTDKAVKLGDGEPKDVSISIPMR
jgi:hypothetical protein